MKTSKDSEEKPVAAKRRQAELRLSLPAVVIGLLCGVCAPVAATQAAERPNIVFLFADDVGWGDVECRRDRMEWPNVDRMKAEGVSFSNAYAVSPTCSPSRAAVLTGQHAARLKIVRHIPDKPGEPLVEFHQWPTDPARMGSRNWLPLEATTMAEALKPLGYRSAFAGKWHLGREPWYPVHQGFDEQHGVTDFGAPRSYSAPFWTGTATYADVPEGTYLTDQLTGDAIGFLERQTPDRPFLLTLFYYGAHAPYQGRKDLLERFLNKGLEGMEAHQAAQCAAIDESAGRIRAALDRLGLSKNTLVVFSGDQGSAFSHAPLRGGKPAGVALYEGGARVPLVMCLSGVLRPGRTIDEPVVTTDLFPTFVELAGGNPSAHPHLDGRSLWNLLKGEADGLGREAIVLYRSYDDQYAAVREGRWKLIAYRSGRSELFDLVADVGESNDLAGRHRDKVEALRRRLAEWEVDNGVAIPSRGEDLQARIDEARAAGAREVRIEPGVYRMHPPKPRQPHLTIQDAADLVIDASGVTLICESATSAIHLLGCRNVVVKGLTIDYEPLPLSQGIIEAIAPDGTWTDVRIHTGYPTPALHAPGQAFYWVYDRETQLIKLGSTNRAVDAIEDRGGGVFRLDHGKRRYKDAATPGDLIRMPQKFLSAHGIVQRECENVALEDITLHSCPGFGITGRGGSGNVYRRIRIVPGPPPPGATEPRLFSSMFDGINCGHHRAGPVIEHGEFVNTGDDAIAIYSPSAIVIGPFARCTVTVVPSTESHTFLPGDRVRFYRFADASTHDATVAAVEPADRKPDALREVVLPFVPSARPYQYRQAWTLTLDGEVRLDEGDGCANLEQSGRGFRIEGNTIRNGGSRGIVVNQSGGAVRNNRIEHTFLPGIHMFSFIHESGSAFQEDVEIVGNRLAWTGRALARRDDWCGAICITGWDRGLQTPNGHRRLVIADNEIRNAAGLNLQIHCASEVLVRGNRFLDTHTVEAPPGKPRPVDNRAIAWVEQADGVRFEGNSVRNPGPHAGVDGLLIQGPGASCITGDIRGEGNGSNPK